MMSRLRTPPLQLSPTNFVRTSAGQAIDVGTQKMVRVAPLEWGLPIEELMRLSKIEPAVSIPIPSPCPTSSSSTEP